MTSPATILLVDDIAANRDTLRELLDGHGYHFVEAADGPTALQLAAETPPDLVLLDVMMPGMDGYEVCRRLRADARLAEMPVIMVTALDDHASRLAGLEAGADDFITKPFNRAELRARVRTITRLNRYRRLLETQAQLHESEARFRTLAERSDEVFWFATVNPERITFVSPAVEKIWGRPAARFYIEDARLWEKAIHPDDQPRVHAAYEAMLAGQAARFEEEYRVIQPDGTARWVLDSGTPIRNAGGVVVSVGGVARDITERKQAQAEIHKLNAELEQRVRDRTVQLEAANKELEAFSYSVSHDLRAPLRGVDGYIRMLKEECADRLDAEGNRLLDVVRSEATRMGRLIDDLLAFSRLGRQQVESTAIDMTGLARAVFESVAATASAPAPAARFELKPLPPAHGDLAMLRQVFANLIGNAVKYTRKHSAPVIEVDGWSRDGETTYCVKDNGVGFDEKFSHKLFGVFQRLHSEEEFEGTGVGLAIVQRVIHRHGGRVRAEGRPGEGAAFYFTLPTQLAARQPGAEMTLQREELS